jgi:peptidoglycan-N-acetylglucosamine deacetylase
MSDPGRSTLGRPLSPFWRLLESYFQRVYGIEPLNSDADCLIAYSRLVYQGPEVRLQCGTVVRRGDLLLELHFRREALLTLMDNPDPRQLGLALLRLAERDVPRLALALAREARFREVKALHALTLFHRGIARYGFEVLPVEERWRERWFTWWHRLLMARDHPAGAARVRKHQEKLVTKHVWISREALIRQYVENASEEGACPPAAPAEETEELPPGSH